MRVLRKAFSVVQKSFSERISLTPHEAWVMQGKNMERPFTGHLWQLMEVGDYSCLLCDSKLFRCSQKLNSQVSLWLWLRQFLGRSRKVVSFRFGEQGQAQLCQHCRQSLPCRPDQLPKRSLRNSWLTSVVPLWDLSLRTDFRLTFSATLLTQPLLNSNRQSCSKTQRHCWKQNGE